MRIVVSLFAAFALLLGACASDGLEPQSSPTDPDAASSEPIPVEPGGGIGDGADAPDLPVVSESLAGEVDQAVEDLRGRIGTDDLIEVIVAFELTWPDGSLGCPEPGMSYTQALVEGYRIELTDGDRVYGYHGELGREPFLCETEIGTASGSGGEEPIVDGSLDELEAFVIADLARELGIDASAITVELAEKVTWRDGSHGCPEPGMAYTQALSPGARFQLSVGDDVYTYHQGGGGDPFLCENPQDPAPGSGED